MNSENFIGAKLKKNSFLLASSLIAVPAFIVFILLGVIPLIFSIDVSVKDYNILKGISESRRVGVLNFKEFLYGASGLKIIQETLFVNSLSILLGGVYVFLLTLGIGSIRSKWAKTAITSLVLLPALIPVSIINHFLQPSTDWLRVVLYETFCIAPYAVLAGMYVCFHKFELKKVLFITFGYAAVRFMLLFTSDLDFIFSSNYPLGKDKLDVLDAYIIRTGIINMNLSIAGAAYIVKILLQTIPAVIGAIVIFVISGRIKNKNKQKDGKEGIIIAKVGSLLSLMPAAIFILVVISSVSGLNIFTYPAVPHSLINSFFLSITSALLFTLLSVSLAYGMVAGNKITIIISVLFLLFGGNSIGQYFHLISSGMADTLFPVILTNCMYAGIGAYFIYFAAGGIQKISFGQFFMKALPVLLTMLGLGFARFYGGILQPMIYLAGRRNYPVSLLLRESLSTADQGQVSTIGLLLIPVIIGIISVWIGFIINMIINNKTGKIIEPPVYQ